MWFDFEHNHTGIKHEIAVCVITGWIIHCHGPFKGSIHDLTVFRWGLKKLPSLPEMVIGNQGHVGDETIVAPGDAKNNQHRLAMKELCKWHETISGKSKTFECLRSQWRHALNKHHVAFRSCLVIVQLCLENGREVCSVEGHSDPVFGPELEWQILWCVPDSLLLSCCRTWLWPTLLLCCTLL